MRPTRGMPIVRSAVPATARLLRADVDPTVTEVRDDGHLGTLVVEFSRFNVWYEVNSAWEGRFLERIAPGAFRNTIARHGDRVKVLFNHGMDPQIGDKVLGVPTRLEERETGPYMEVPLLDTSYNRDLLPGLRAGAYGASFMFEVTEKGDEWRYDVEPSDYNPEGLPERTIRNLNLFEAGPVTWPANPEATSGVRCSTDQLLEELSKRDEDFCDHLYRSFAAFRAYHGLRRTDEVPATPKREPEPETLAAEDSARHVDGISSARRKRRLFLLDME